jgi:hypothetical protein
LGWVPWMWSYLMSIQRCCSGFSDLIFLKRTNCLGTQFSQSYGWRVGYEASSNDIPCYD